MLNSSSKPIHVLAVEDNAADRSLLTRFFKNSDLPHELHFSRDGEEAMDYLFQRGPFASVSRPDLVLLDLNMPKRDGREVLKEIKCHPNLRTIPVVVLTTSSSDTDVNCAYEYQANSYIQKPRDLVHFQKTIEAILTYWLSTVELPRTISTSLRAKLPEAS